MPNDESNDTNLTLNFGYYLVDNSSYNKIFEELRIRLEEPLLDELDEEHKAGELTCQQRSYFKLTKLAEQPANYRVLLANKHYRSSKLFRI